MRIAGGHAVAVIDLDHLSVTALAFCGGHRAVSGGVDVLSIGGLEIDPCMVRHALEEGIAAFAETAADLVIGYRMATGSCLTSLFGGFKRVEGCAQIVEGHIERCRGFRR